LVTPFYLHFLGIESYGLIGFFTTLLTLVQLLDLGLSPTMNREVARHAGADAASLRHLFRSMELLYWSVALFLSVGLLLAAGWIGRYWLQSTHLMAADVVHAVMLMALVVAVRWPIGLYSACLMGAQRLAVVSGLSIVMVTLGAAGSVTVLAFLSPTIGAFFLWQVGVSSVHVVLIRWLAWRAVGGRQGARFKLVELHRIWRFSAGVGAIAVTGVLLMQFDKMLLSKLVDLGSYGRYMLATLLASGLYLLATPMFNALYPRFSMLVVNNQVDRLVELYGLATRLLATLALSLAAAVSMHAEALIRLWTQNALLSAQVAPIASVLVFAAALHGVLFLQYALQLAYGMARLALLLNAVLLIVYVPLSIVLTVEHAGQGAAIAWLLLQLVYLGLGTFLTHRYLLEGHAVRWLLRDLGIPLCASLAIACAVAAVEPAGIAGYPAVIWTGVTMAAAVSLSLTLSPALRSSLYENMRLKKFRA
jgi:O-antigen/teichoic acid export membrane protein